MIVAGKLRGLAWAGLAAVALALLFALSLHVNALKSKVRQAELRIVALKHEKLYLETEFETRANQRQLQAWNQVDFGYVAPGPGQFVEDGRALAALGTVREPEPVQAAGPAAPVRMAQRPPAPPASASASPAPARDRPVVVAAKAKAPVSKADKAGKAEKAPVKAAAVPDRKPAAAKPAVKLAEVEKPKPKPKSKPTPAAEPVAERPRKVAALDVRGADKSKEERGR